MSLETGARLRIITSDTSVGRLAALRAGAAKVGRLGDEYIFGFEGVNEFATRIGGRRTSASSGLRCHRAAS